MRGAIAIAYRKGGGSFASPTIVDSTPSSAPAVALGRAAGASSRGRTTRRVYGSR